MTDGFPSQKASKVESVSMWWRHLKCRWMYHGISANNWQVIVQVCWMLYQTYVDLYSVRRHRLIVWWIPIINLRRSSDRLIFIMRIPIPLKRRLFSEWRPWWFETTHWRRAILYSSENKYDATRIKELVKPKLRNYHQHGRYVQLKYNIFQSIPMCQNFVCSIDWYHGFKYCCGPFY